MNYEIIIGLEIHVQLQTQSKMFSPSGTDFGLPPNTQTDPVSLGLPGTLPVMNRKAFDLALKTAVAMMSPPSQVAASGSCFIKRMLRGVMGGVPPRAEVGASAMARDIWFTL